MLIPHSDSSALSRLNQEIKVQLGLPGTIELNAFPTMASAVREIPMALAQMYPHKMSIYYSPGVINYLDETAKHFSRLGYKVLPLTDPTLATANKDTLILLLAENHPVTGELYEWSLTAKAANEKKFFCLRTFCRKNENLPGPYDIFVMASSQSRAVAIGGEKTKFFSYYNSALDWEEERADDFIPAQGARENKSHIENFEGHRPGGCELFFKPGQRRVFDRAVIYWRDMDGLAFVSELINISKKGWRLGEDLDCTSLCRWSNSLFTNSEPQIARGLVVLSVKIISDDLEKWVSEARSRVLVMQGNP